MAPTAVDVLQADVLSGLASQLRKALFIDGSDSRENNSTSLDELLYTQCQVAQALLKQPYCLPLYILHARTYESLGYPDLSAGAAYKALLLADAIRDDSDEYHNQATEALEAVLASSPLPESCRTCSSKDNECNEVVATLEKVYLSNIYESLITSLLHCGSFRSAHSYCSQAVKIFRDDARFEKIGNDMREKVAQISPEASLGSPLTWPDQGYVRRELYPWDDLEPDRFANLDEMRAMMSDVAPKFELLAIELPVLSVASSIAGSQTTKQLGIFAKEDIMPGEVVLKETSLLTANNKLLDALCDACSADLPSISSSNFEKTVSCDDCEAVFCSQECHDRAIELYHPALCDMDVEAIARDVPPAEAANSLYSLLLLRALAMSETQQVHPLALKEVKYIWGDFHNPALKTHWSNTRTESPFRGLPQTLPFSFEYNIRLPFHMLEKMDIDIFQNPQYDVWVFNTLYAKFRGTASARLSGLGGRAIRGPEVSAVHPMWCMANHSCDPNVSWEWGGSISFWAREERVIWRRDGEEVKNSEAGIRKGEELLNHYCDVELGVQDRREWASGSLGGMCRCARCVWESRENVLRS